MKIYEDLTKFNRVNYVSDSAELNSSLQLMGKTAANLKYLYGAELKPGGFKIELEFDVIISNLNQIIEIIENFQLKLLFKLAVRLQLAMQLLDAIQKSGAEIVSYKKKKEVTIEAHHFLDEIDRGTFLHLYVPKGRYQEDQLASLLRLFESYLQRIENLPFFIDSRKTSHGRLYEFKSKNNSVNLTDMEIAFSRFENFMNLCQNDLKNAETLLLRAGISPSEVSGILAKYMKEYQRLLLDTEQERKRKLLDIGLRLESDIFEYTNATDIELLQSIQPTSLLSLTTDFDPINITIYNSSVSLNSGTQSFIEQAIYGDIHYTPQDRELIHLFEKYAERFESVQLRSKLEELKDTSIPETERKTAMKKIVGFLYNKVAPAVSQSALTLLTTYLQKVLTGS